MTKWTIVATLVICNAILHCFCFANTHNAQDITLKAPAGFFRGTVNTDGLFVSFKGIKFAVAERFKPPVPFEYDQTSAQSPFNATEFGAACWQRYSGDLQAPQFSEDCLFLNVWIPKTADIKAYGLHRWPVVVYIHGGLFVVGAGSSRLVNPAGFVGRNNAILVSINYRLGVFGFWRHRGLTSAQPTAPTNFGLLDQQAALRWVRNNIRAFGGDTSKITVMGESAGATSILSQLTSVAQMQQPLFQRAIIQNAIVFDTPSLEQSYAGGQVWAEDVGCSSPSDSAVVACMRDLPPALLIRHSFRWNPVHGSWMSSQLTYPIADTVNFPDPLRAISSGNFDANCDILIGGATNESSMFTLFSFPYVGPSAALFHTFVESTMQPHEADVFDRYNPSHYGGDARLAMSDLLNDIQFQCPLRRVALNLARHGSRVRRYLFNYQSRHSNKRLGVAHGHELVYIFENPIPISMMPSAFEPDEWLLSRTISDLWAQFSHGEAIEFWPFYEHSQEALLQIGNGSETTLSTAFGGFKQDSCEWFDQKFPQGIDSNSDFDIWQFEELRAQLANEFYWMLIRNRGLIINSLNLGLIVTCLALVISVSGRAKNLFKYETYFPKLKAD